MPSGKRKTLPKLALWKLKSFMLLLALVVVLLLYGADKIPLQYPVGKAVVQSLAALVLTSGIVSVIANILVRQELTAFWLTAIGVRDSVTQAGLFDVGLDFHSYDFHALIRQASRIDVMVINGEKWFGNRRNDIKEFLSHKNHELRVCLLHEDSAIVPLLSQDFGYKEGEIKQRIHNAMECLTSCIADLKNEGQSTGWLRIWKHRRSPKHTYYRFDAQSFLVPYNQAQGHTAIPVIGFIHKEGGVSDFLSHDFNGMLDAHAEKVYDSREPVQSNALAVEQPEPKLAGTS